MVQEPLTNVVATERSVDAARFLKRGRSLLDTVVLIEIESGGEKSLQNGLRLTSDLAITLHAGMNLRSVRISIGRQAAEVAWTGPTDALVLRTPRYEGSLPDLSLSSYVGGVALLSVDPFGETRLGFGRTRELATHDAPSERGSMGAPVFDDTWNVIGLHRTHEEQGNRTFVPISQLTREIEQAPCWDEIAAVHRLVRSVESTPQPSKPPAEKPDIVRAVRWNPDDPKPMAERERRRAIAGATLDQLKAARGSDAASTPEQRALDAILAGPTYELDKIADDILLPFATAARWFREVAPALPDDAKLEYEIGRRRQINALEAMAGPHFAPRPDETEHLNTWLSDGNRPPMVVRGPGGIGKSALVAHWVLEIRSRARFAWIDFDRPDVSADEPTIARVVDDQLSWQAGDGPLVVVLDSFETSVQTYGYTNLNPALDALARRFDDLGVVVGSRAPVPLLKVQGQTAVEWELVGLPTEVAAKWLVEEGISTSIANDIALTTNGVPLNLRLARDLVKGKSEEEAHAIVASLPKQLLTGYLYRRILRRLRDDTLKEQAQWAMVPRRLVPELLAAILRVTPEEAQRLFTALRSELTLLEGDTVLTVRTDLRNTLLPLLEADDAARVRDIDTIAADFWSERASDDVNAAEAIYHALRLADLSRADKLWRSGAAHYLRGYTIEEIPPASGSWLESRVSHDSIEKRVEDLVARGRLNEAQAALSDRPKGVATLSQSTRRRRLLGLAEAQNFAVPPHDTDTTALESIVLSSARPVMRVRNGTFEIETPAWSQLNAQRANVERAIAAVARVQLADGKVVGTSTLVGRNVFLTTRGVVETFAVGMGRAVKLVPERRPSVDLHAEGGDAVAVCPITRVVLVHPYWDIAIFETNGLEDTDCVALETSEPPVGREIVVIGHPSETAEEKDLIERLFGCESKVKRVMPGRYVGAGTELSYGRQVTAGGDDASTLGLDFGAAVIDPENGRLLGVRFVSNFLTRGAFVPAWELARDPEIAKAGVTLADPPQAPAEWTSTWGAATSPRHLLLDAYLARTSGDIARAQALLELVPVSETPVATRIERAILEAACYLGTDPQRAGDLLHGLVAETPADAWPDADRNAAIATRLRLVVDADAEREFLQILHDEPRAAGLLTQQQFRVLVPPRANLQWRQASAPASALHSVSKEGPANGSYPTEAIATAERIVAASDRCTKLEPWIRSFADQLANLSYLFNRSTVEVRELAAAYIAYPAEVVRPITEFLLERTDLAPHPTKGWEPIVQPLLMMFRDVRGGFPDQVQNSEDLVAWLDSNAGSGRLGSYLTKLFQIDTDVAWQAGLLHLATPLPIESLLKRRFSAEKAT